jgi:hypothetical protein
MANAKDVGDDASAPDATAPGMSPSEEAARKVADEAAPLSPQEKREVAAEDDIIADYKQLKVKATAGYAALGRKVDKRLAIARKVAGRSLDVYNGSDGARAQIIARLKSRVAEFDGDKVGGDPNKWLGICKLTEVHPDAKSLPVGTAIACCRLIGRVVTLEESGVDEAWDVKPAYKATFDGFMSRIIATGLSAAKVRAEIDNLDALAEEAKLAELSDGDRQKAEQKKVEAARTVLITQRTKCITDMLARSRELGMSGADVEVALRHHEVVKSGPAIDSSPESIAKSLDYKGAVALATALIQGGNEEAIIGLWITLKPVGESAEAESANNKQKLRAAG